MSHCFRDAVKTAQKIRDRSGYGFVLNGYGGKFMRFYPMLQQKPTQFPEKTCYLNQLKFFWVNFKLVSKNCVKFKLKVNKINTPS